MGRRCPQFGCVRKADRRGGSRKSKREKFRLLFERQGGVCAICLKPMLDGGNLDHIIPASMGGTYGAENLRATHRGCNSRRGNSMDDEFFPAPGGPGGPG